MVRGIAVMRRRADSFVNATQILKVAGVDKGRRTKILEKEILPGKHEIVQGGYGKYQGTWYVSRWPLTLSCIISFIRQSFRYTSLSAVCTIESPLYCHVLPHRRF